MLRNALLSFVAVAISLATSSQTAFPDQDELADFFNTETLVVLENTMFSTYNTFIKSAMKEHWEITPYRFISVEDFEKERKNPDFSFIVLTETSFDRDKTSSVYNYINLLLGKDVGRIEDMPEICAVPLSFAGEEDTEYAYKAGIVLGFLQAHARHLSDEPSLTGKRYLKYYNKFIPDLSDMTILLSENDLVDELKSAEIIEKLYEHDIRIVDDEEIQEAILKKKDNTVILHMVGPESDRSGGLCFKMLIGTMDGMVYFYGEHKITPKKQKGLLVNDMKRIGRF